MKLILCLLLTLSPAVSGFSMWGRSVVWPFNYLFSRPSYTKQCTCTTRRISLDDKMALLAIDNDYDNNGIFNYYDLYEDIINHFDKNYDGRWSEEECVEGWSCRYGDTLQVARYVCASILLGRGIINLQDYNFEPFNTTGMPLTQLVGRDRGFYEEFYNYRCVNRELSVEEKLSLLGVNNDFNNDGLVTLADFQYDLDNFYDVDKDGAANLVEFVTRWICNYGDSGEFARYLFDLFSQGSGAISVDLFRGSDYDTGVPVEKFKDEYRERYANFRNRKSSSYH